MDTKENRQQLKQEYDELYLAIAALFFRHDPIGINFKTNTDEYEPEVSSVLPRLPSCNSALDVQRVLHEEFTYWFVDAGSIDCYAIIAAELWHLWKIATIEESFTDCEQ
jgi:hypothetical protein